VTQPLVTVCYSASRLQASRAEVQGGDHPVGACGFLWRPGGRFNPRGQPLPALQACVLPGGAIGVFPQAPGTDVCSALGLAYPATPGKHQDQSRAILRAQDTLSTRFLDACVGRDAAVALARQVLRDNGLADWRVSAPTPFPSSMPCASVGFDPAHRTVQLVPISKP
jgi:hypothetical protein